MRRVVMVTGLQAAGKSTVGPLLAERLRPPAASFDGDVLHRMVRVGRDSMTPSPSAEALRQLKVRYDAAAHLGQHYVNRGYDFVYNDIVLGSDVTDWMEAIHGAERHLVVLNPCVEAIAERELGRGGGNSYRDWQKPGDTLADAVRSMSAALDDTPRRGCWLDTSTDTPEQVVDRVLTDDMRGSLY